MNPCSSRCKTFAIAFAAMLGPMSTVAPAQFAPVPPGIDDSSNQTTSTPEAAGKKGYVELNAANLFLDGGKFSEAIAFYRAFLERYGACCIATTSFP